MQAVINRKTQKGAALLALLMVFIVAASYSLINKLNANTRDYLRQGSSLTALNEAKAALIGYAVNYPEIDAASGTDVINGPGYLPCPDRDNDGDTDAGACSLGGNTTIGRLPYKTLEIPELKDSSGARLWYALSDNFRNNPGLDVLNSETEAQFTLDGFTDIVAVIIAPGVPIGTQNRDSSDTNILTEIANYLELENSDVDGGGNFDVDFTATDPDASNPNDFNDLVIAITRQELMDAVEKRVLGEVKAVLLNYETSQGAYPWLSTFADPKTVEKRLTGAHSGSDNQANLTDSSADFTEWGVTINDIVWNITDGSYGLVTGVSSNTLNIGGMNLGNDNDFDSDDEYYVDVPVYSTAFIGTATATVGSSNLVLEDSTKDFDALNVQVGDIVEIVADGSSGIINDVTSTTLTVSSLSGSTNAFSNGLAYRIRTSLGRATTAGTTILTDTNVDFTVMGIQIGDLIRNITDGSFGRVSIAPVANQLTVDGLKFGTNNAFGIGDYYVLPRYNAVTNTRKGLLSFHEPGEYFYSDYDIDWSVNASAIINTGSSNDSTYNSGLELWTSSSSGNSGTVSIDSTNGQCNWINVSIADCEGYFSDTAFLTGRAGAGSSGLTLIDNNYDFSTAGLKRGDIVENISDGTTGIIFNISSSTLTLVDINDGNPDIDFSNGEGYRIHVGTSSINFSAASPSTSYATRVYYSGVDLSGVQVGDTLENRISSDSIGTIISFGSNFQGDYIEHTVLEGPGYNDVYTGEPVRIIHNRVDRRDYKFDIKFNGFTDIHEVNEIRKRDVCLGYGNDCASAAINTSLPGNNVDRLVTISDFDSSNIEIGSANAVIPIAGVQGTIKLSNLDMFLSETYDNIPSWFIDNGWHKLVYVAFNAGDAPGAAAACVAGTDCLTLNGVGTPDNNKQALVFTAGAPVNTTKDSNCNDIASVSQDRTSGNINDYYELENCNADDVFEKQAVLSTFNDKVKIIEP